MTGPQCMDKFLGKVGKVLSTIVDDSSLPDMADLFAEMQSQIDADSYNRGKIVVLVTKHLRTDPVSFHEALRFLSTNWPPGGAVGPSSSSSSSSVSPSPRVTRPLPSSPSRSSVVVHTAPVSVTSPTVVKPLVTAPRVSIGSSSSSSSPGSGAASRWESIVRKQEEEKRLALEASRSRVTASIESVARSSKKDVLELVTKQLNAGPCTAWLEYLQSSGSTGKVTTCAKDATPFNKAVLRAKALINPLLKSRSIYDDSRAVTENPEGASGSQGKETMIRTLLNHYGLTDFRSPLHWFAKGMILNQNPEIQIRCDGSAALAFYKLVMDEEFKASIGLVQQGEPGMSGHWFLVAGVKEDLLDDNINPFGTKAPKRAWCFVIDLWGAAFQHIEETVHYPAQCIAGDWTHKILWLH